MAELVMSAAAVRRMVDRGELVTAHGQTRKCDCSATVFIELRWVPDAQHGVTLALASECVCWNCGWVWPEGMTLDHWPVLRDRAAEDDMIRASRATFRGLFGRAG